MSAGHAGLNSALSVPNERPVPTQTRESRNLASLSPHNPHRSAGQAGEAEHESLTFGSDPLPAVWLAELRGKSTLHQCPAHRDSTPSLSVMSAESGSALIHDHGGCSTIKVLCVLGLRQGHLFIPPPMTPRAWVVFAGLAITYPPMMLPTRAGRDRSERLDAIHDYGPGRRLLRYGSANCSKRMVWESRDERGAWIPGLRGVHMAELPLYRAEHISITAALGEQLYLVESESSVDALTHSGRWSITWAGGAAAPPIARLASMLGPVADVRVVADHDGPGIDCARQLLTVIDHATGWLPPTPGDDVRDVLATDPTLSTLIRLTTETP
jgi:hypothetical protein